MARLRTRRRIRSTQASRRTTAVSAGDFARIFPTAERILHFTTRPPKRVLSWDGANVCNPLQAVEALPRKEAVAFLEAFYSGKDGPGRLQQNKQDFQRLPQQVKRALDRAIIGTDSVPERTITRALEPHFTVRNNVKIGPYHWDLVLEDYKWPSKSTALPITMRKTVASLSWTATNSTMPSIADGRRCITLRRRLATTRSSWRNTCGPLPNADARLRAHPGCGIGCGTESVRARKPPDHPRCQPRRATKPHPGTCTQAPAPAGNRAVTPREQVFRTRLVS